MLEYLWVSLGLVASADVGQEEKRGVGAVLSAEPGWGPISQLVAEEAPVCWRHSNLLSWLQPVEDVQAWAGGPGLEQV